MKKKDPKKIPPKSRGAAASSWKREPACASPRAKYAFAKTNKIPTQKPT